VAFSDDRSIGALFVDIVDNLHQIVRAELRLARVEIAEQLAKVRRGAILLGAGGVVIVLALGVLLLAVVWALATVIAPWAAALVVAVGTAALGGVCVAMGLKQFKQITLAPKAAENVEETVQWAKTRTR
jgi:uncharacterized membrane protein YqjE